MNEMNGDLVDRLREDSFSRWPQTIDHKPTKMTTIYLHALKLMYRVVVHIVWQ